MKADDSAAPCDGDTWLPYSTWVVHIHLRFSLKRKAPCHVLNMLSHAVQHFMQALEAGATETGAIAVIPSSYTLSGYLASYNTQLPTVPVAYYINDRFLPSIPGELVEDLTALYANATSPYAVLLIEPGSRSVGVSNNSDTAFGYRDSWIVWVWPFWLRTAGGAAVDGKPFCFFDISCPMT